MTAQRVRTTSVPAYRATARVPSSDTLPIAKVESWNPAAEADRDAAACDRADAGQRQITECWARVQRERTIEAMTAYAWALRQTRGRAIHRQLPRALGAWERYGLESCRMLGAAWEGGSRQPATIAACHADRAREWTSQMYGVILMTR
ncbi:MAG: hypothetical protein MUD17_12985 [Gemmatimonadaceae bacterium]|nr:hypothetical protein [Gemmatimonadaceae bacterium]